MESMRSIADRVNSMSAPAREQLQDSARAATSARSVSVGTFTNGARVIDLATGRDGEVITTMRQGDTEVFGVRLVDGRVVHRGAGELESLKAPR